MDITDQCTKEWLLDAIQDVNGKAVLTSNQLQVKEANLASQRLEAFIGYAWRDTLDSDRKDQISGHWIRQVPKLLGHTHEYAIWKCV